MKASKILSFTYLILVVFTFISTTLEAKSMFNTKTVEISLPTVQCDMCKKTIEKALSKINGIMNANIDIENKRAIITYDDTKTSLSKIEKTITKVGYDANNRKANKNAYEKLPECCKMK